ncbi:hypothetical protein HBI25_137160 [Parastagonospora nodorum]|nr:hypothetical protein HBH61_151420 [Parastagonospora nodorum]KAH4923138.1 hypothetical protein HBH74_123270 [Parastagonospora nodorum]KAH4932092.1 hypothetical protein HBI79_106390 [Parastagonospora nodorum]KAH4948237.1 hypothetical protein HBH73_130930 [Parastagonospora nodorum]KAH5026451.1 hypothetical protein HBI75_141200 [Parastagonospora nodorum]
MNTRAPTGPLNDLVEHQCSESFGNEPSANIALPQPHAEHAGKTRNGPSQTSKDDPFHAAAVHGLTQYYPDKSDVEATVSASVELVSSPIIRALIDDPSIIAIHGLATHAPKTWMAYINGKDDQDGSINWLSDETMLPDVVKDARILSYNWKAYYTGKEASTETLIQEADSLLFSLHNNRTETKRCHRPIIFVCSCFGGLLLAKALPRAIYQAHPNNEIFEPIAGYTIGAFFLGTPFRGSWEFGFANANALMELAKERQEPIFRELVGYLRPKDRQDGGPSPLDEMVQVFTEMVRSKKFGFQVLCFYETEVQSYKPYLDKFPEGVKPEGFDNVFGYGVPVPEASAVIDGSERISVNVKHNMLSKHNSNQDQGFVSISCRMKQHVEKAQEYLAERDSAHEKAGFTLPKRFSDYIKSDRKHESTQKENFDKWVPETCSTLLTRYLEWRDSSESTTLICEGKPGTGKSVFTSVVVDNLQQQNRGKRRGIAYLYLDYKTYIDPKKPDTDNEVADLLRSILKQLLRGAAYIPQVTSALYLALKENNRQPSAGETEEHIIHVLGTFWARSIVVIDALDECNQMSAEKILEFLAALQKKTKLGIVVTSRPNKTIAESFDGIPVTYLTVSGEKKDIETFLRRKIIQTSPVLKKKASEEYISEIVDIISTSSEGMFELASLQLGSLVHAITVEDVNTIVQDFRGHRDSLPSFAQDRPTQLYDYAYEKTMKMIETMPGACPRIAMETLSWIVYGPADFTPDELLHALAIKIAKTETGSYKARLKVELYDLQDLIRLCAGLLVVEGNAVQLAHYTTREFLVNNISRIGDREVSNCDLSQDKVKIERSRRRQLANLCVAYLALDVSSAASGIDGDHPTSTRYKHEAAQPLLVGESPFYTHAACHLEHYIGNLELGWDVETVSIFTSFLEDDQKIKTVCKVREQLYDVYGWAAGMDTSHSRGPLALLFAVSHDLISVARFLLRNHPSPMSSASGLLVAKDRQHYTPLCWAIRRGNKKLVKLLLEYSEVDPGHKSYDGPPLVLAAYSNSQAALKLLLERTRIGATEALFLAVQLRLKSLIRTLINQGVDPSASIWMKKQDYMGFWAKLPGGWGLRSTYEQLVGEYWTHEFDTPQALACRKKDDKICDMMRNQRRGSHRHTEHVRLSEEHQGLIDRIYWSDRVHSNDPIFSSDLIFPDDHTLSKTQDLTEADILDLQLSAYQDRFLDPPKSRRSLRRNAVSLGSGEIVAGNTWEAFVRRRRPTASEQEPWKTPDCRNYSCRS